MNARLLTDERSIATLPGPVVSILSLAEAHARRILREPFEGAVAPVKVITCRLPGVHVRRDGSHEAHFVVPKGWHVPVVGTTI